MFGNNFEVKNTGRSGFVRTATVLIVGGALLAGCSQVPDAINPVEWYNSSVEFFSGEEQEADPTRPDSRQRQTNTGADQEFPALASVDQQQRSDEIRKQGLVADTEGRKYAPAVTRQGEAVNALGAPPQKPAAPVAVASAAPTQPAPAAVPAQPVVSSEVAAVPAMPATDPLASTEGQQDFQAQMARRLAEIRARAAQTPALPRISAGQIGSGPIETVVITADGVQADYGAAAVSAPRPAAVNTATTYIQRPMQPIAPGAVKVATIMFENGSARISARDRSILANVRKLQQERGGRLRVIGHASSRTRNTDPVRHKMINFKVSAERADAVARELLKLGLDKNSLQIDAVSDSAPVYYEFMPSGEAGNRRAEIYLES